MIKFPFIIITFALLFNYDNYKLTDEKKFNKTILNFDATLSL